MIAFHYPPYQGGSGVHRTLKFSRYLPEHGWQPIVMSANPRAYLNVGKEQSEKIPEDVIVEHAFALDTARHLSVRGRYWRLMALPDQWVSWWTGALWSGLRLIRKYKPEVLWSTYPIATAHLIGFTLHRLTGIPWIADFRDSMTEDNYPRDIWSRRTYRWIERGVVRYSLRLVFTTKSTRRMYLERYPTLAPDRALLVPNGYDEDDFKNIVLSGTSLDLEARPIRLLHAGVIYMDDRDPSAFFTALSRLKSEGKINSTLVNIDLMASGSERYYAEMIKQLGVDDIVRLLPALSHQKALQECADADALLLFQAASCNHQIPAKVYEYLRLRKPILALTPHEGDTAALLDEVGGATVVDLADVAALVSAIPEFINRIRSGRHPLCRSEAVRRYARSRQACDLARTLNELTYNSRST